MKAARIILPGALFVCGCAGAGAPDQAPVTAEQALTTTSNYGSTERCLSSFEFDAVQVLDDRHVLFLDGNGGEVWLNTLRARCPGLSPRDTLAFRMMGSRLCSLDLAEVMGYGPVAQGMGPSCTLGEFQRLSPAQARMIHDAL